jgi:sterol desaturase/sphingolipid hydroxylase (fatty acid hydroxylase superfamily)
MFISISQYIFYFFAWTFIIYWVHRIAHIFPSLIITHRGHHRFVAGHTITWHWSNIFLFNDDWTSTIDFWITEVIPTAIFVFITEQWWLGIGFYLYAAFLQEWFEHNKHFNGYPFYTSGKWHLLHHTAPRCNYGIGTPFWDWVFNTNKTYPHRVSQ